MCGDKILKGWYNVDKYNLHADLQKDILDLDFPESSVDEIFWHHGIEHLSFPEGLEMLKRIHKWLRIGGTAFLVMPDLQWAAENYRKHREPPRIFRNLVYGVIENGIGWEHKSGYDDYSMGQALKTSGWREDEYRFSRKKSANLRVYLIKKYDSS